MARNDAGIAWFLELLAPAGRITARRMFGGTGLYADGTMIALEADGTLYLKVDDASRARFDAAGGVAFAFESKTRGTITTHYLTPPDEALDSPEAMRPWALLAKEAAQCAAIRKRVRGNVICRSALGAMLLVYCNVLKSIAPKGRSYDSTRGERFPGNST